MPRPILPLVIDGRAKAIKNEIAVLKAVRDYGHLRRREIARAVWGYSTPKSAQHMAQRTVSRLVKLGMLAERINSLGTPSLLLTTKGAAALRAYGMDAQSTLESSNVTGPQFYHRTLGTTYLLEQATSDTQAFGEFALIRGVAPVAREEFQQAWGKVPDGLLVTRGPLRGHDDFDFAADWIEVESSYKGDVDIQRMLKVAWEIGTALDRLGRIALSRVVFVYDSEQRHEAAILSAITKKLETSLPTDPAALLRSIIFTRAYLTMPLSIQRFEAKSALQLLAPGE